VEYWGSGGIAPRIKNTGHEVHHYAIFSTIRIPPFQVQISSSTLRSQKPSVCVPQSERPSFAPIQYNQQNYSFVYFHGAMLN